MSDQDVYFIREAAGGPIKIGRSSDVAARFRSLQTATWRRLELIGVIVGNGRVVENDLKERFAHIRIPGSEWFYDEPELLLFVAGLPRVDFVSRQMPKAEYARLWRAENQEKVREYNESRRKRTEEKVCPCCERTFEAPKSDSMFCGNNCRNRARWRAKRGRPISDRAFEPIHNRDYMPGRMAV
jgi:hypothetical protein